MVLETLARDSGEPLGAVQDLYDKEYAALAEHARVTNYISLLAVRRVRYRLLPTALLHLH
jgi:hypothetical protein